MRNQTCFVELQTVGVSVEELAVDGYGESLVALLSLAVPQDVGAVAVAVHLHQHDDLPQILLDARDLLTHLHLLAVVGADESRGDAEADERLHALGIRVEDHHADLLLLVPLQRSVVDAVQRVTVDFVRTHTLADAHQRRHHLAGHPLGGENSAVVVSVALRGRRTHRVGVRGDEARREAPPDLLARAVQPVEDLIIWLLARDVGGAVEGLNIGRVVGDDGTRVVERAVGVVALEYVAKARRQTANDLSVADLLCAVAAQRSRAEESRVELGRLQREQVVVSHGRLHACAIQVQRVACERRHSA